MVLARIGACCNNEMQYYHPGTSSRIPKEKRLNKTAKIS